MKFRKRKAKAIADAAEMVVDGFAVLKLESGYKIVNAIDEFAGDRV